MPNLTPRITLSSALLCGLLAACNTPGTSVPLEAVDEADPELLFLGGYRSANDTCERIGETAFTNEFLDDSADLVACPTGSEDDASLRGSGATVATQTTSFTLYSIARR